ncbi:MAG TPA: hypothetical protein VM686_22070, partial [Polyangiaceae bacterium]|nr:hypothetical protein [Polyangiaceae bacterium]
HEARRKLHRGLIILAEAVSRGGSDRCAPISSFQAPELTSLLALREMFSVFRGALVSAGEERSRLSWALEVVALELQVLLANPVFTDLPHSAQLKLRELNRRVSSWGMKELDPMLGRALYREACAVPSMASDLSISPLLVDHDAQILSELSALLSNEPSGSLLEHKVLGHLSSLRGLDVELDRLELNLVYGAAGVLGTLSLRVNDLRSRLSRPVVRAAASWS